MLLRGDTDFSQTKHLDRWSADPRVRFIFGMDCTANLHMLADDLPECLETAETAAALPGEDQAAQRGRTNVKEAIVREREFENIRLESEEVAEFDYRPDGLPARRIAWSWCKKYLAVEKGEQLLFDDYRYFFYLTNDRDSSAAEIVLQANDRCDQENLHAQLKGGVRALHAPVDNLVSNWAYMVMTSLAWNLKAWWALSPAGTARAAGRAASRREKQTRAADGVQDVRECLRAAAVPDRAHRPAFGLSAAGLESLAGCSSARRPSALLTCTTRSRSPDAPVRRGPAAKKGERLKPDQTIPLALRCHSASVADVAPSPKRKLPRKTPRVRLFKD